MYVDFEYLTEALGLALNPLLNDLSPVDRVVTRVWSHVSGGSYTQGGTFIVSDWLREFLSCQSKDLIHQNKNSLIIAPPVAMIKSINGYYWKSCCFHLQDI